MSPVSEAKLCGWAIASVRDLRGLNQDQLAKKAEMSKQTIWRTENGVRPVDVEELKRIAKALEWDLGWLMEPPIPPTVELGPPPSPDEQDAQNPDGTLPFEHPSRIATVTQLRPQRPDDRQDTASREQDGRAA